MDEMRVANLKLRFLLAVKKVKNKFPHARLDFCAITSAAKNPIVANAGLDIVYFHRIGNTRAQIMGSLGLADTGDIVVLAFNGHQCNTFNGFWLYKATAVH